MIGLLLSGVFLIVAGVYATTSTRVSENMYYVSLTEAEFTRVITGPWGIGHDVEARNVRRILDKDSLKKLYKLQKFLIFAGVVCLGAAFSRPDVLNPRALSTTVTLFVVLMLAPPYFYWRITVKRGSERRLINVMEIVRRRRFLYLIGQFFLTLLHAVAMLVASILLWIGSFKVFSLFL